ncbi:MAG: 7TM-DISM domain-containing protein [Alcanivoracaceae bacterium]
MRILALLVLMLTVLLPAACAPVIAGEPLRLSQEVASHPLEQHLSWYRDATGQLTLDDILMLDQQGAFTASRGYPSFGYTRDTVWVRFQVRHDGEAHGHWLLEIAPAFLDEIELFQISSGGVIAHGRQGDHQTWQDRDVPWRQALYNLTLNAGEHITFYLRVRSTSSIAINAVLQDPGRFASDAGNEMLLIGAVFSIGMMMIVISLFFLMLLRQRIYFYFLLYVTAFTFCFAQLEGLIHFAIRPASALKLEWLQVVFQGVGLIAMTLLFCELAELHRHYPLLRKWLIRLASAIAVIGTLPMLAGAWHISIPLLWLPIGLLIFAIPFVTFLMRKKLGWIAWLYSLAFGVIAIGLIIRFVWVFGAMGPTPLSENHFPLSMLLHMCLLFITLAARYVQVETSMRQTSERALNSIRESERRLEAMVTERTAALDRANQNLNDQLSISQVHSGALEQARDRLALALESERHSGLEQRRFLRMVAHEFRTPLSVIQMAADMIRSDPRTPDVHAEKNCPRIQQASERMASLINQALREDRLDSVSWRTNSAFVQVAELLQSGISYGEMISSGRHQFELQCDQDLQIQGDHELLLTMVNNIIDNAVKYSPSGAAVGVAGYLDDDGAVCLRVADDGPGMSEDECRQVLDKYFRSEKALTVPGMGLGLYLVDRIIRLHDARLDINSTPGKGTVFTVRFPNIAPQQETPA